MNMTLIFFLSALSVAGILFFNRNRAMNYLLVLVFSTLLCVLTCFAFFHKNETEFSYFTYDAMAVIMLAVMTLVAIPAFYHSYVYFSKHRDIPRERGIYFAAMVILITALCGAVLSGHIGLTWVCIELTTLSASALVYHRRNPRTLEGTWKYVFVVSISITIAFIGILFLSIAAQEIGIRDLTYAALRAHATNLNPFWLKSAFLFIFTGFTAKTALFPMFTAGVDAKDKAPSPAGALFSSILLNGGFVAMFRMYEIVAAGGLLRWANTILLVSGIVSLFVAATYLISVKNIKRILAYSSIENMAIITLGLAAGGAGYYAALLQLVMHALVKSGLFFQVGQLYRVYNSKNVYDMGNYFGNNTAGAMALLLAFFCIMAIPPSGLFVSEFLIFSAIYQSSWRWLLIPIIILIAFIIWSLTKNILKIIFSREPGQETATISRFESVSQFILIGISIYIGYIQPAVVSNLVREAIQYLPQ